MAREEADVGNMVLILNFLKAATDQGKSITAGRTSENAHVVFSRSGGLPELEKPRFWALVNRAVTDGLLREVANDEGTAAKTIFKVTATGARFLLEQPGI